ncbi:MAG: glycosyltransferase [Ktedonobacterales bacterium]
MTGDEDQLPQVLPNGWGLMMAGAPPDAPARTADGGDAADAQPRRRAVGDARETACDIAILIPCYNEETTIGRVVRDFAAALPEARIYVYDNNSTDATAQHAAAAGAFVRTETMQGKGHVVRRMFRDVDADMYVLVDGDGTYDATLAPRMLATAIAGPFDLVNAIRVSDKHDAAYRAGHRFGNRVLTGIVQLLFGHRVFDMLSGYKVLSRRFVKSFPALSKGFEIETELTVHALELALPVAHVEGRYAERPAGSASKLHTIRDGRRILLMIVDLVKQERPLLFFCTVGLALAVCSIILGVPVVLDFLATHLVLRLPTALLSTGLMLIAFISGACGLILDTVTRGRREAKTLAYLSIPFVPPPAARFSAIYAPADAASAAAVLETAAIHDDAKPRRRGRAVFGTLLLVVVLLAAAFAALIVTGAVHLP